MRASPLLLAALGVLLLTAPAASGDSPYKVELDPNIVLSHEKDGKRGLFVTIQVAVNLTRDDAVVDERDKIVVEEDGKVVAEQPLVELRTESLTTVLAMDVSGSMRSHDKIGEARKAADAFLDDLDARSDSGLILFDHLLRLKEPPGRDGEQFAAHRKKLHQLVQTAKPGGGTSYLDAAAEGLHMFQDVPGRRAVVLMTDGVDMNSVETQQHVIDQAKELHIPIYTIGIGEPGTNEPVTTVLVLDHSGSMAQKAEAGDQKPKIQALREAASRFVELMRPTAKTTLLPFSSDIETPQPFLSRDVMFKDNSTGEQVLKRRIQKLEPDTGTLLYDATWTGVETLAAARLTGKKAVVVLTDGVDESPGSRRTDKDVIDAANAAGVKLYMLGLGPTEEINEPVMKKMAVQTHGEYFHAENQQMLFDIFEKLSIDLHDDGVDVQALTTLAHETGGEYYSGQDVSQLAKICQGIQKRLESTYTITSPSLHPDDGTARNLNVYPGRGNQKLGQSSQGGYTAHGVIVPQMDHRVYLLLLAVLAALLAAPAGLRRLYKRFGG